MSAHTPGWRNEDQGCAVCGTLTNHNTMQHEYAARVMCQACDEVEVHDEDQLCSECVSEQASYFVPDEGGSN